MSTIRLLIYMVRGDIPRNSGGNGKYSNIVETLVDLSGIQEIGKLIEGSECIRILHRFEIDESGRDSIVDRRNMWQDSGLCIKLSRSLEFCNSRHETILEGKATTPRQNLSHWIGELCNVG